MSDSVIRNRAQVTTSLSVPDENVTWRDGFKTWAEARFASIQDVGAVLKAAIDDGTRRSDDKAQAANDALERLLAANMKAATDLNETRIRSTSEAVAKVEKALAIAHASSEAAMTAMDRRLNERITSMNDIITLRSDMGQTAIEKAGQATEKRFESVNEFRQTLSDQAQNFVTRAVLDGRVEQLIGLQNAADIRNRETMDRNHQSISELITRMASLEAKVYVGGACIIVLLTLVQLVLTVMRPHLG